MGMALSDTFVRQVKYSGKGAGDKHTDGDSLYLFVNAAGKYWRLNYRYLGKQKTLALGVYPEVSLKEARQKREEAKGLLASGKDPMEAKKAAKRMASRPNLQTFGEVAKDWLSTSAQGRKPITHARVESWFQRDVFPFIGDQAIAELTALDVLSVLRRMEARGVLDSTKRVMGYIGSVFEYAMVLGLADRDPTVGLHAALKAPKYEHYASLTTPDEVGQLLRTIWEYSGRGPGSAGMALRIAPYVFVRPGELRHWEWAETDLDGALWLIPGEKMKMGIDHMVPLAQQVVALLRYQHQITGHGRYVFPSMRGGDRPMSENTVNVALRTIGYGPDKIVGHGFRAMARTMLDEVLGERVDLIEHQLAHAVRDANGRAYNRTAHLPARREMMQRWADYLDRLRLTPR
jgi:integrase